MAKKADKDYGWSSGSSTSLHDKLKEDLKNALRNKDNEVKSTIRQIMAEFSKLTVPITLESGKKSTRIKKHQEITNSIMRIDASGKNHVATAGAKLFNASP